MTRPHALRLSRSVCLVAFCFATAHLGTQGVLADPVRVISRSSDQFGTGDGASTELVWDQSGRFGVFRSKASNLVTGQNTVAGTTHLFQFDRLAGTTRLVSHIPGSPTVGGNAGVFSAVHSHHISADGKWVAYTSPSPNLVSGQSDTNGVVDVFLWNRESDSTLLVSRTVGSAVTAGDGPSFIVNKQATSSDGRYVLFESTATNLVAGQIANTATQVFQFDRLTGLTVMVSHAFNLAARSANDSSSGSVMSADGRWVVFTSLATNHIDGLSDSNEASDIFLWDRDATFDSSLRLISRKQGFPTSTGSDTSNSPAISADGTGVAFRSDATNLEGVTLDTNGFADAFHYDRSTDVLSLVSHRFGSSTQTANGTAAGIPALSDDGDWVAFESVASNLVFQQDDSNNGVDVFLWNGPITLVSHIPGSAKTTGNSLSSDGPSDLQLAGDASVVAFLSSATNLVAGVTDSPGTVDVFSFRRDSGLVSLVSHAPDETQTGLENSIADSIALGGRLIGFSSRASNFVIDDDNGDSDVFFHDGTVLFADCFEAGDTSAWSLVVP